MKSKALVALATVSMLPLLACSASSINTTVPEAGAYAPSNQQTDGEVSYLNAGAKRVRDARRTDAYKKMHSHCGGDYEIVKEEDQEGMMGTERRIWFKCVGTE